MQASTQSPSVCDALAILRGVTAIVGGGGKTTLMLRLGSELSARGRVLLCTTTRILPPECTTLLSPTRGELAKAFREDNLVAVGSLQREGKLGPVDGQEDSLFSLADYIIVEADGARRLPLKAPDAHEPVLPKQATLVVAIAGMDGIGQPICDAAHRPALFADLLGKQTCEPVTPEDVARVLSHPQGQRKAVDCRFAAVLNKADTPARLSAARDCARLLPGDVCITSLVSAPIFLEVWRDRKRLY